MLEVAGVSVELQLENPKVAISTNTISVDATRKGVQKLLSIICSYFFKAIFFLILLLLAESERLQDHRHLTALTNIFYA